MTAEEYLRTTPDTTHLTELIDGEIVDFGAPSVRHQDIVTGLAAELRQFVKQNGGNCKPFAAPLDVRLDDYNVVEPDVFITCTPENITNQYYNGAPDFVAEVVSTNRRDDFDRKLLLYRTHGVREYWIIDPQHEKTLVYYFADGSFPDIYTFDTPIPVRIWGGRLTVTISELELL